MPLTVTVPFGAVSVGPQYYVKISQNFHATIEIQTRTLYASSQLAAALIEHAITIKIHEKKGK